MYKGRISECFTNLISGVETTVNKYYKLKLNNKKKCCDKFKVKKKNICELFFFFLVCMFLKSYIYFGVIYVKL